MHKLEGQLPYEWTRIQWADNKGREIWEPRISAICKMVKRLEFETVSEGYRKAGMYNLSSDEFITESQNALAVGLSLIPVSKYGDFGMYQSSGGSSNSGPWTYRVILSNYPKKMLAAYKDSDYDVLGYYLGYPACCRNFFHKVWEVEKGLDSTWQMAEKFVTQERLAEVRNVQPQANVLLRWLGVRAVFHLPCSFECQKTIEVADQYAKLAVNLGFYREQIWLKELLSWPIEWSALHGIAEIKTPVFRISTRTDLTGAEYKVKYYGTIVPTEGSRGMQFPYIRDPYFSRPDWWTSNGFKSKPAMEESHNGIIGATVPLTPSQVFDFGCGNGALLDKIGRIHPQADLIGIEVDPKRIQEGRELYSNRVPKRIQFYNTLIRDFRFEFIDERAVGIISTPRFVEGDDLTDMINRCKIRRWILYSYNDTEFKLPIQFKSYRILTQHKDAFTHLVVVENVTA